MAPKDIMKTVDAIKHWADYQRDLIRPLFEHMAWLQKRTDELEAKLYRNQMDAFTREEEKIQSTPPEERSRSTTIKLPPPVRKTTKGERMYNLLKAGSGAINGYLATHPGETIDTLQKEAQVWMQQQRQQATTADL